MLNGLAGGWRKAIVNPDIFLLFVNPVLLVSGYVLLFYYFQMYMEEDRGVISKALASIVLTIATVVVLAGVFWKALTT